MFKYNFLTLPELQNYRNDLNTKKYIMKSQNENEVFLENEEIIQSENEKDVMENESAGMETTPVFHLDPDEPFEPIAIGVADYWKTQLIEKNYEILISQIDPLLTELKACLKLDKPLSFDEFFEYLKATDFKLWLFEKYIALNDVKQGDLDPIKLMALGIIHSPDTKPAIELTNKFQSTLKAISEENFYYPIKMLWNPEMEAWDLTTEFYEQLEIFNTRFTQTAEQNFIVKKIEQICSVLNELSQIGVVRPKNGPTEINFLNEYLTLNKFYKTAPAEYQKETVLEAFTPDPYLFHKHRLSSFRVRGLPGIQENEYSNKEKLFL